MCFFGILSTIKLLLTKISVHTGNISSDIQGVWIERSEWQNKYYPYGPKSRLIGVLLYTYTNEIVYDKILPVRAFLIVFMDLAVG